MTISMAQDIESKPKRRNVTRNARIQELENIYRRSPTCNELRALDHLPLSNLFDESPGGRRIYALLEKCVRDFDMSVLEEAGRMLYERITAPPDFSKRHVSDQESIKSASRLQAQASLAQRLMESSENKSDPGSAPNPSIVALDFPEHCGLATYRKQSRAEFVAENYHATSMREKDEEIQSSRMPKHSYCTQNHSIRTAGTVPQYLYKGPQTTGTKGASDPMEPASRPDLRNQPQLHHAYNQTREKQQPVSARDFSLSAQVDSLSTQNGQQAAQEQAIFNSCLTCFPVAHHLRYPSQTIENHDERSERWHASTQTQPQGLNTSVQPKNSDVQSVPSAFQPKAHPHYSAAHRVSSSSKPRTTSTLIERSLSRPLALRVLNNVDDLKPFFPQLDPSLQYALRPTSSQTQQANTLRPPFPLPQRAQPQSPMSSLSRANLPSRLKIPKRSQVHASYAVRPKDHGDLIFMARSSVPSHIVEESVQRRPTPSPPAFSPMLPPTHLSTSSVSTTSPRALSSLAESCSAQAGDPHTGTVQGASQALEMAGADTQQLIREILEKLKRKADDLDAAEADSGEFGLKRRRVNEWMKA